MIDVMRQQVLERLHAEPVIMATPGEVAAWDEAQLKEAAGWLDALLRRKEGAPRDGDSYDFPAHVAEVVKREARDLK